MIMPAMTRIDTIRGNQNLYDAVSSESLPCSEGDHLPFGNFRNFFEEIGSFYLLDGRGPGYIV